MCVCIYIYIYIYIQIHVIPRLITHEFDKCWRPKTSKQIIKLDIESINTAKHPKYNLKSSWG